jgi:leader peptidase (prepilin peptidase)/N-methyltransferase
MTLSPAVEWLVAAAGGAALGRLLTACVGPLVGGYDGHTGRGRNDGAGPAPHRLLELAAVVVAVAVWWWEVVAVGQVPRLGPGAADASRGLLACRCAAHLVLFTLLAAAAWVDLRHRVIPDCITVPGVIAGLLWMALQPDALLPIAVEVPRSFAPPLRELDVLGLAGGLHTVSLPSWLGGSPGLPGLAVALAIFTGWWIVCTAPFLEPVDAAPNGRGFPLVEPRNLVLAVGLAGIGLAWWHGGLHWAGLLTSLAGIAVSAGMIWLTRAGASSALGREAMGLGDVTLMAMVGAWLGWQACVLACFLAVFIGLLHGLAQVVLHRETELPFGPSLCIASAAVVVGWRRLWEQVGVSFERPLEMAAVVTAVIVLTAVSLLAWRRFRAA